MVLESVGYRVEDAASVSSADAALARLGPDVVLTDWLLPDGNGLDVCRALGRRRPDAACAGGCGHRGDAGRRGGQRAEDCPAMVTVLQKPANPDAILAAIRDGAIAGLPNGVCAPRRRVRSGMRRRCAGARGRPEDMPCRCRDAAAAAVARSGDSDHTDDRRRPRALRCRQRSRRASSPATTRPSSRAVRLGSDAAARIRRKGRVCGSSSSRRERRKGTTCCGAATVGLSSARYCRARQHRARLASQRHRRTRPTCRSA